MPAIRSTSSELVLIAVLISHFNCSLDGGAATAARRLHAELIKAGADSRFYHSARLKPEPDLDASYQPARWRRDSLGQGISAAIRYRRHRQSFKRITRQRSLSHEIFTSPRGAPHTPWPPLGHPTAAQGPKWGTAEIIHLHWIARLIDYASFFPTVGATQPIVWTLHDMNAFTGGCHFSEGCQRFQTGCGHCPQLPRRNATDISHSFFQEKRRALEQANLHIVAPSQWLLEAARSSLMFSQAKSFTHIPYAISTSDYYPMDRYEARARLGIDPDATVFCFGAMDVKTRRKGARQMLQALSSVADLPNVEGIVFGSGTLPRSSDPLPRIHEVGPVHGLLQQRTLYSASDVFVLPSLEDNLPLTGLEAMACGTAIVGFDAGGIPDYVQPNQTGLLAPTGNAEELGRQLRALMSTPERAGKMGRQARRWIEDRFADEREAAAYQRLYAALLDSSKQRLSAAA